MLNSNPTCTDLILFGYAHTKVKKLLLLHLLEAKMVKSQFVRKRVSLVNILLVIQVKDDVPKAILPIYLSDIFLVLTCNSNDVYRYAWNV